MENIKGYPCDPNKNTTCRGRFKEGWCGVECKLTLNKEYAKTHYVGHCANSQTQDELDWDGFDDDEGLLLVQGEDGVFHEYDPKLDATFHFETKEAMEYFLAQVEKVSGKCKTCKFFEYDSVAKVDGIPLIVAHEICKKWGEGCKTSEDGYCFMYEPKEVEE